MVTRKGYESTTIRIRWIDYARVQAIFPPLLNESAVNYFRRLALKLKELAVEVDLSK